MTLDAIEGWIHAAGPQPVERVLAVSRIPSGLLRYFVAASPCLVIRQGMLAMDDQVEDPEYGLIYRKEAVILRMQRAPTLQKIAEACRAIRSRRGRRARTPLGGGVDNFAGRGTLHRSV